MRRRLVFAAGPLLLAAAAAHAQAPAAGSRGQAARLHRGHRAVGHHLDPQLRRPRPEQHRRGHRLRRLRLRLRRRREARHLLPAGPLGEDGQRQPRPRPHRPAEERALPREGRLPVRGRHGQGRGGGPQLRLRLLGGGLRRGRRHRPRRPHLQGAGALPQRGQRHLHRGDREGGPRRHALEPQRRLARLRPGRRPRPVRGELPGVRRGQVPLVLRGGRLPGPAQLQRRALHPLPQQRRRHLHRRDEGGRRRQPRRARHERGGGRPRQRRLDGRLRRQRLDGELLLREPARRDVRRQGARARAWPSARTGRASRRWAPRWPTSTATGTSTS